MPLWGKHNKLTYLTLILNLSKLTFQYCKNYKTKFVYFYMARVMTSGWISLTKVLKSSNTFSKSHLEKNFFIPWLTKP